MVIRVLCARRAHCSVILPRPGQPHSGQRQPTALWSLCERTHACSQTRRRAHRALTAGKLATNASRPCPTYTPGLRKEKDAKCCADCAGARSSGATLHTRAASAAASARAGPTSMPKWKIAGSRACFDRGACSCVICRVAKSRHMRGRARNWFGLVCVRGGAMVMLDLVQFLRHMAQHFLRCLFAASGLAIRLR